MMSLTAVWIELCDFLYSSIRFNFVPLWPVKKIVDYGIAKRSDDAVQCHQYEIT